MKLVSRNCGSWNNPDRRYSSVYSHFPRSEPFTNFTTGTLGRAIACIVYWQARDLTIMSAGIARIDPCGKYNTRSNWDLFSPELSAKPCYRGVHQEHDHKQTYFKSQ